MRVSRTVHSDPGLQPERTILAWNRTFLALMACGLLFLRWLPVHHAWALLPLALAIGGAFAILIGRQRSVERAAQAIRLERAHPPVGAGLGLAGLLVATGLTALLLI